MHQATNPTPPSSNGALRHVLRSPSLLTREALAGVLTALGIGLGVVVHVTYTLLGVGLNTTRIDGHTDSNGPEAYNDQLSLKRAKSVADVLVDLGIDEQRIQVEGYGDQYPVDVNATERGRAQNRRVEIVFSDDRR